MYKQMKTSDIKIGIYPILPTHLISPTQSEINPSIDRLINRSLAFFLHILLKIIYII